MRLGEYDEDKYDKYNDDKYDKYNDDKYDKYNDNDDKYDDGHDKSKAEDDKLSYRSNNNSPPPKYSLAQRGLELMQVILLLSLYRPCRS